MPLPAPLPYMHPRIYIVYIQQTNLPLHGHTRKNLATEQCEVVSSRTHSLLTTNRIGESHNGLLKLSSISESEV